MIDEALNQAPELTLDPVLTPEPEPTPAHEPEPVPTPPPVLELPPDDEPDAPPVEVISVEELLERLQTETGEPEESPPPASAGPGDTVAVEIDPGTLAVLDRLSGIQRELVQVSDQVADIQLHQIRAVLTTSFRDYTVMEGLLLLLLLAAFLAACAKILKGGFSWLRS